MRIRRSSSRQLVAMPRLQQRTKIPVAHKPCWKNIEEFEFAEKYLYMYAKNLIPYKYPLKTLLEIKTR